MVWRRWLQLLPRSFLQVSTFVVHGEPAVAMAVGLRCKVRTRTRGDGTIAAESSAVNAPARPTHAPFGTSSEEGPKSLRSICGFARSVLWRLGLRNKGVDIRIFSEIPIGVGLGSSGATAVSTVAALAETFEISLGKEKICNLSYTFEKRIHGQPSGIDQTTSTFGGIVSYSRAEGFSRMDAKLEIPIVIGNTGIPRATGVQVMKVRRTVASRKEYMKRIMLSAGEISRQAVDAIKVGDLTRLGQLLDQNHELLRKIGVSCTKLDELVYVARQAGALGAKMTGAGGGGCMIALTREGEEAKIARFLEMHGATSYIVGLDSGGVKSQRIDT